jgi:tetratricopeptide (TPR) repeat protein
MKSLRKPLFWGLVLLLVCLICCAAALVAAYIYIIGQQRAAVNTAAAAPVIVYPQPTLNKTPGVKATTDALHYQMGQAYKNGEDDKVIELQEKIIALNPNDPKMYYEAGYGFREVAERKHSLDDYMDLLNRGITYVNKGIEIDPKMGDLYMERAFLFNSMGAGYPYRVDYDYLNQLALENLQASSSLRTYSEAHPERYWVSYLRITRQCDQAIAEAERLAAVEPADDVESPTIDSLLASAYGCKGDYEKALKYYQIDLRKRKAQDDACSCSTVYYYLGGKTDEALERLNKSISDYPNYNGTRYFLRALIEYDRGEYDQALQDAETSEGESWAHGINIAYIEGMNDARLGKTADAIEKLQYAEATFRDEYYFVAERAREALKKLKATPLAITPSVQITATPMPVYPTLDLNTLPTHTPKPASSYK